MTLQIENLDDLWHLYNIIEPGDFVYAQTFRRVREDENAIRADSGEKVKMYLGIKVEGAEFHEFSNRLRIKGVIIKGPENLITLGAHHTHNIEVLSQLLLKKDKWTEFQLICIDDAVAEKETDQILITVIDERESTIALVTNVGIKIIAHLEENIPGKHFKINYLDQSVQDFFKGIRTVLLENYNAYNVCAIVVAGPGFTKEHFIRFLREKVPDLKIPILDETTTSADKSGIYEVIKRGAASKILGSLRVSKESELVEEVLRRLGKSQRDVSYGFSELKNIALVNAIETLLVTDLVLRGQSIEKRQELDELIRSVENTRGKVYIISTLHPAGEQLQALGGIAALLRFAI